jgi:hypothetical protein
MTGIDRYLLGRPSPESAGSFESNRYRDGDSCEDGFYELIKEKPSK